MAFNKRVDPRLLDILQTAAARFPVRVEYISGYRPGDPRQHGKKRAIDIQLYDSSGRLIPNYQNGAAFRAYEQFAQTARQVQQEKYPDLSNDFRWGGYFSGSKGKYGAVDLMHFDFGGMSGLGMGGGSWDGGLTKAQRRLFPSAQSIGIANGGLTSALAFAPDGSSPNAGAIATEGIIGAGPRTLHRGLTGDDVSNLQRDLASRGLYKGKIDGDYGPRTQDAVRAYQMRYGLNADGIAGPETVRSLGATGPKPFDTTGLPPPGEPTAWPDTFNPPSGLPNVRSVVDLRSTFSPGPGGSVNADLAAYPNPQARPGIGSPASPITTAPTIAPVPDQTANLAPDSVALPTPDQIAGLTSDQIAQLVPDTVTTASDMPPPQALAAGTPTAGYPDMPPLPRTDPRGGVTVAGPPDRPIGSLPASADPFVSSDRGYDPIVAQQARMQRDLAAQMAAQPGGAFLPPPSRFDEITEPGPVSRDAFMPPPFSDRAGLAPLPPTPSDITTANSPFAAGVSELPPPRIPDFGFAAGPSQDQSLQTLVDSRRAPPAPPVAAGQPQTAQSAVPFSLDKTLSNILPSPNLLTDLNIYGGGGAAPVVATPQSLPPPPPAPSPVRDPFNNYDPNKDQSRLPGMGPESSLRPMGNTTIQVADASGTWPSLTSYPTDLSTANSPNAAMGMPQSSAGVTLPGPMPPSMDQLTPAGGDPGIHVLTQAEMDAANPGDPMQLGPSVHQWSGAPAALPAPPPVRSEDERKNGFFKSPAGRILTGFLGGGPVGAVLGAISGGGLFGGVGGFNGAPLSSFGSQYTSGGTYNPWGSAATTGNDPKGFNYAYNNSTGQGYYTDSKGNVHSYSSGVY